MKSLVLFLKVKSISLNFFVGKIAGINQVAKNRQLFFLISQHTYLFFLKRSTPDKDSLFFKINAAY